MGNILDLGGHPQDDSSPVKRKANGQFGKTGKFRNTVSLVSVTVHNRRMSHAL
jgi:hypothetical protein